MAVWHSDSEHFLIEIVWSAWYTASSGTRSGPRQGTDEANMTDNIEQETDEFDLTMELACASTAQDTPPPLRPHQAEAWSAIQRHWAAGRRRVCAAAPTGAGKSRLGKEAAMSAESPLCVVHTKSLRAQNNTTICRTLTVQGILAMVKRVGVAATLAMIGPVDLIIHDEAHHFCAKKWAQLHELWPDVRVLGLTATPERGDGAPMRPYYDELVKVSNYEALIRAGYLVPDRTVTEDGKAVDAEVGGQSKRVKRTARGTAESAYFAVCHEKNLRTIVFCEDRTHADETHRALQARGVKSALVLGHTSDADREEALAGFRAGELQVLINVDVLIEGIDLPCTEAIILWISCGTVGRYLQICGRGLRAYPGKTECVIVDISGASLEFGRASINREYSLDGKAISAEPSKYKLLCNTCARGFGLQQPPPLDEQGEPDLSQLNGDSDDERAARAELRQQCLDQGLPFPHAWFRSEDVSESLVSWAGAKGEARAKALETMFAEGRFIGTKAEKAKRVKDARARGKKLEALLGCRVWLCEQPANGTLCPHCSQEQPRSKRDVVIKERVPATLALTNPVAPKAEPVAAPGLMEAVWELTREAVVMQRCVSEVLKRFRARFYSSKVDEATLEAALGACLVANPAWDRHQKDYLDEKIRTLGWKDGVRFHRHEKFVKAAKKSPKALAAAERVRAARMPSAAE